MLHRRRLARPSRPSLARRARGRRPCVRGARAAECLLELLAAVRSVAVLHAPWPRAYRQRGGTRAHQRARAALSAARCSATGAHAGPETCRRDRTPGRGTWPISAARPRARDSDPVVRGEREPLVDLGGPALSRRRVGHPHRRGRRQRGARRFARIGARRGSRRGRARVGDRAARMAGAGSMAVVVCLLMDSGDRLAGGVATNAGRDRDGGGRCRAGCHDARVGRHQQGARPTRRARRRDTRRGRPIGRVDARAQAGVRACRPIGIESPVAAGVLCHLGPRVGRLSHVARGVAIAGDSDRVAGDRTALGSV